MNPYSPGLCLLKPQFISLLNFMVFCWGKHVPQNVTEYLENIILCDCDTHVFR